MAVTANQQGSWSERNIVDIVDCLDIAFANVLESEFDRLTAGMSSDQINDWLYRSERSIRLLRESINMPDYSDRMMVLRYVILYQLGHINLAYTLIKDSLGESNLTDTGRLQVVDFGAGCLAMSFGVGLAVADALTNGESVSLLSIDAIDTGRPMMDLGRKLWQEFIKVATNRDNLAPLLEANQRMELHLHSNSESIRKIGNADCWVSALHTLYDGGEVVVKNTLSGLCIELEPDRLFVTCFEGKVGIAQQVLPSDRQWVENWTPELRFTGDIDNSWTTEIADTRGFKPDSWSRYYHKLYTDCYRVVSFTSALIEEEKRSKEERRREAQEQERQRESRRQRDRERRRRQREEQSIQRQEQETQRKQQEAELLSGSPGAQGRQSREQARLQRIQEEARQQSEQEQRHRTRQEHSARHRVETLERLQEQIKESLRRVEQVQQREERERQQRQQRQQEEARQQSERERQQRHQEEARQQSEREQRQRTRQEHSARHRVDTRERLEERLKESQRRAEQVQQREERERQQRQQRQQQTRWQRIQEEGRQRMQQELQQRRQEEARRHSEPAGAGSSRNQRSGSRSSESSNTGASGGFGRRVLQRVRAWLNRPKA